jgi:hypothetical protein
LAYCRTEEEDYLIPQMAVDCVLAVTCVWHPIKIDEKHHFWSRGQKRYMTV